MNKTGTYYLGRVIKLGTGFTQERFLEALKAPTAISVRDHDWTIASVYEELSQKKPNTFLADFLNTNQKAQLIL